MRPRSRMCDVEDISARTIPKDFERNARIHRCFVDSAPRSRAVILKFLTRRSLLSLITLAILSVVVFLGGQLLPGDVGRAVLGPLADARAVAVFDHQVGVDRPLLDPVLGLDHALRRGRHGPILHLSRAGGAVRRRGAGRTR